MLQNKQFFISQARFLNKLIVAGMAITASALTASASAQTTQPISVSVDTTSVHFTIAYSAIPTWTRVYVDSDRSLASGYPVYGVGADYMIENGRLYKYAGANGTWSWTFIKTEPAVVATSSTTLTAARSDFGSPAAMNVVSQTDAPLNVSGVVPVDLSTTTTSPTTTAVSGASVTVKYAGTTAVIPNPERGFYRQVGCETPVSLSQLKGFRTTDGDTLMMCVFYLRNFVTSPISQAALDLFQQQMDTVRSAGLKAVVRFAYNDNNNPADAKPAMVSTHLTQLAPYLAANKDVIAVVQAGFIGSWGEWGNTQNYGDSYNMTAQNIADRKSVVDKLLSVLPAERTVQLRMPLFKTKLYSTTALTSSEAFTGTAKARLGFHNDCFLSNASDYGTYVNLSVESPYLAAESNYVPTGGETCAYVPPRSDCPTAVGEMAKYHWSFLNQDYNQTVLNNWKSQGCYTQVNQKLGYRFVMTAGAFSGTAKPGGAFSFNLSVQNQGWSAPFNSRDVEVVFRNTATGALYRVKLAADPRRWLAGQTIAINQTVTLPATMPKGYYALLLNLPDPQASLRNRPEYSIQMANSNTWESATGFNNLNLTVGIAP